jgi:hypothetical protein
LALLLFGPGKTKTWRLAGENDIRGSLGETSTKKAKAPEAIKGFG